MGRRWGDGGGDREEIGEMGEVHGWGVWKEIH